MDRVISGKAMKKVDTYTIKNIGIPSMVLMERAAMAVTDFILDKGTFKENTGYEYRKNIGRVLCLCGTGNNGADGIAVARQLKVKGFQADVIFIGAEEKSTSEWKEQKKIAINCGVNIRAWKDIKSQVTENSEEAYNNIWESILQTYDFVVDALFGIGLTREIEGDFACIIKAVNDCKKKRCTTEKRLTVVSVDVPSGLDADTGKIMSVAVAADYTITFGVCKSGLILHKGKDCSGRVIVAEIGFPDEAYKYGPDRQEIYDLIREEHIAHITDRQAYSNKGTYGKVLIVAGSENIYGAAYFSAMAALKTGCGLVRIITHKNNRELLYKMIPEAIIQTYDGSAKISDEEVLQAVLWADVTAIGSGLGTDPVAKDLLEKVMRMTNENEKSLVIDADGLNIISSDANLKKLYHRKVIITPHMGEASRLTGVPVKALAEDIIEYGKKYAYENKITMILKDSTSVILGIESLDNKCNNRICVNPTGNAGMATAGSGDILTGIVAGVLAGGVNIEKADREMDDTPEDKIYLSAAIAAYIHGLAGDKAAKEYGETSMTATDILNMISKVIKHQP